MLKAIPEATDTDNPYILFLIRNALYSINENWKIAENRASKYIK